MRSKASFVASGRKITQAEIAREADVGTATVDRVLNERPGVNIHTVHRVRQALRRLQQRRGIVPDTREPGFDPTSLERPALVFDFILPAGPNTFLGLLEEASGIIGREFEAEGVQVRCHRVVGFNPQYLADCIRKVAPESDGLAVMALENPLVREAVTAAVDDGTPVVTIVSNLSTSRLVGYVGLNNRAAGRTAAYLMQRLLHKKQASVALLKGSHDLSYRDHQEREVGFRDAFREYAPDCRIIGGFETQDNYEEAYRQTQKLLRDHGDVAGLYSIGGGVRGIAAALKDIGAGQTVTLIAHELTRYTRAFLLDGTIDAILAQDPMEQARNAVRLLSDYHRTGRVRARDEHMPMAIYFRENLP